MLRAWETLFIHPRVTEKVGLPQTGVFSPLLERDAQENCALVVRGAIWRQTPPGLSPRLQASLVLICRAR
eukprot:7203775-Lingulodinium_polyedra.AAC.1